MIKIVELKTECPKLSLRNYKSAKVIELKIKRPTCELRNIKRPKVQFNHIIKLILNDKLHFYTSIFIVL